MSSQIIITAKLMQVPYVELNGQPILFRLKKAEAVFYYLLINKSATRAELAALLWTGEDEEHARRHLRDCLYFIKKNVHPDVIIIQERSLLQINPQCQIQCDAEEFLQNGGIDNYKGQFLQGFDLGGADGYDEWMANIRESIRSEYLRRLLFLAEKAESAADFPAAEKHLTAYLQEDALSETAAVQLMQIYQRQNNYNNAAYIYQRLYKTLADELGITPLKETSGLYHTIMEEWNQKADDYDTYSNDFLVGRYEVYRRLLNQFDERKRMPHQTRALALLGEAGIGKTHLLNYFLEHADLKEWLIISGTCYKSKMNDTLYLWQSIMITLASHIERKKITIPQAYLQSVSSLFPAFSEDIHTDTVMDSASGMFDLQSTAKGVLAILSLLSQEWRILLVIEDIHWIDKASSILFDQALHKIHSEHLIFMFTCRQPAEQPIEKFILTAQEDRLLLCYELPPFTSGETMQFIEEFAGGLFPEKIKQQIYQETRGNAFLLVQLLNSLLEQGKTEILPSNMEEIMAYRLAGLSPEGQQVLNLISMFPENAPYVVLTDLSSKKRLELLYICQELCKRSLIYEIADSAGSSFVFVQAEFRELVYSRIQQTRRQIMHRNIAQILSGLPAAHFPDLNAQIIHHYTQGGDLVHAFQYRVKGLATQISLCYELLPGRDVSTDLEKHAEALALFDKMKRELAQLRQDYPSETVISSLELEILYAKSCFCIFKGLYAAGLASLDILFFRTDTPKKMMIGAHLQMIYCGIQTYDTEMMEQNLSAGLALAAASQYRREEAVLKRLVGLLLLMKGDYAQSRRQLTDSISEFDRLLMSEMEYGVQVSYVHNYLGESFRREGNYEAAIAEYTQALQIAQANGALPGVPIFYTNIAQAVFAAGQYEKAYQLFEDARRYSSNIREPQGRAIACAYLGLYAFARHDDSSSIRLLELAEQYANALSSPQEQGIVLLIKLILRIRCEEQKLHTPLNDYLHAPSDVYLQQCERTLAGIAGTFETALLKQYRVLKKCTLLEAFWTL